MKSNFEKQIKDSLDQLEYQYDPKAWKAMRSRLDSVKPVSKLPVYLGIGTVAALIVAGIFVVNAIKEDNKKNSIVSTEHSTNSMKEQSELNNADTNSEGHSISDHTTSMPSDDHNSNTDNLVNQNSDQSNNHSLTDNSHSNNQSTVNTERISNNSNNNNSNQITNNGPTPNNNNVPTITYFKPSFKSELCSGLIQKIENKNDFDLFIIQPNGQELICAKKQTFKFTPVSSGTYTIGYYKDGNRVKAESFIVLDRPEASISIVSTDVKYENGLPVVNLFTSDLGSSFEWNIEGVMKTGKEVGANYFTKGRHKAELTITGANGCKTTASKQIDVAENYNLMAVTSFVPTDADPANSTFMPYSLKVRNTPFTMIVIDPKDGHILFQTSDASLGWDGVDRQTGQTVPYEVAYIWKVILENPEKNELPEYAGTIIPLANRR